MHHPLPLHREIAHRAKRPALAIAAKGFRPFFLLAAAFACAIIPIWLLIVSGALPPSRYLDPASWHAHEMVFGFAVAVIAGFLLTAVGNWTQRETLVGPPLLALASVWLLGRIGMAIASALPRGVAAGADLAFLPVLFVVLARPILVAGSKRNFMILGVVAALFVANVVVHLDALGVTPPGSARHACLAAIDLVVFLILVIGGRVIPIFTRNATGRTTVQSSRALDIATVVAMGALVLIDVVAPETRAAFAGAGIVAVLAIARAARWGTIYTARHPLLWILHAGYAWVAFGLILRALPFVGVEVWSALATHALTVGAIGSLTLGMMARVALGHTGRPLDASRATSWAFVAITASAFVRVVMPLAAIQWHRIALDVSATLWAIAFGLYLAAYAPMLTSPRVDGKPG